MAVLNNCHLDVNGTDVTAATKKVEVDSSFEDKDSTTYGDNKKKTRIAGLEDGNAPMTFVNNFAAGQLDATMWGLRGTVVTANVWPNKDAVVSSANPRYSASILIIGWKPISGSVGDLAEVDISFPVSGGWNRYTTT